jgi:beta-xylosidase
MFLCFVSVAFAASGTYTNPIIRGDYPDPGALYTNGSFFVATTGNGFPIHESTTLGTWTAVGSVFGRHGGPVWAKEDFWA